MDASADDGIFEMFFDKDFVPQAFVDLLLTNDEAQDLQQIQTVSSTLLSKMEFYTKQLNKELQSTVSDLEGLTDSLPGTWTSGSKIGAGSSTSGVSKLEYYLDTMESAVRALQLDLDQVEGKLNTLDVIPENGDDVIQRLRKLQTTKSRLHAVLEFLKILQSITNTSIVNESEDNNYIESNFSSVSLEDFKNSLHGLEINIYTSLEENNTKALSHNQDGELINKIRMFTDLTPLLEGLSNFHTPYLTFVKNIKTQTQKYIDPNDFGNINI